jgi:radical SAM protein with 4Fe4S-binding SPASM domain
VTPIVGLKGVIFLIKNIVKVKKINNGAMIFNSSGRVVKLSLEEYAIWNKYKDKIFFPKKLSKDKEIILDHLAGLNIIGFKEYNPKNKTLDYNKNLYFSNNEKPIHSSPLLAHLAITNICNMHCEYCSVRNLHKEYNKELDTKTWKRIIKKLSDFGVFQIGFTGGEPTLRKDIFELIKYTKKQGCVCNLTTNGWHLSEEFVKKLKHSGLTQCQISLDSFNENIHDKLRGAGSLTRVLNAIELLQRYNICVGIDTVVSKNNLKDIPNLIKECEKRKIEYLTLIKIKKGDLSEEKFNKLCPKYFDYSKLIERLFYRKNEMPNITLDCGSISNLQYALNDDEQMKIPTAGCPLGHNLITISPNGDIFSCAALLKPEYKLGNILSSDLKQIWENHPLLNKLRNIKNNVKGKCKSCERLDFCRAGCRGIAEVLSKDIFSSDLSCQFKEA